MISTNSSFTQIDIDTESRRALAKVYALLLRLAEEREKQKASSENVKGEEASVPLKNNIPPTEV